MKLAVICFSILTSFSFWLTSQQTPPLTCRKPLPIALLPGPEMTMVGSWPLRFGGTRDFPRPWVHSFPSNKPFRLVIKSRDEFGDFWKRRTAQVPPGRWVPPLPEIDFSKEMIVVAAMGHRWSTGYAIIIDGACEVDGQIEVFVTSLDSSCTLGPGIGSEPADAVRLPRSDLPIVFRETQIGCPESLDLLYRLSRPKETGSPRPR